MRSRIPTDGYYDPRDIFTTVPRSSLPSGPYAQRVITSGRPGALRGMRIGIIREFMVQARKGRRADRRCGRRRNEGDAGRASRRHARRVGDRPAGWTIPTVENMSTTFDRAIAELAPVLYPDLLLSVDRGQRAVLSGLRGEGEADTEFAPGVTRGTGTMTAADWMVRWAEGLEPSPRNLTLRDRARRRWRCAARAPSDFIFRST